MKIVKLLVSILLVSLLVVGIAGCDNQKDKVVDNTNKTVSKSNEKKDEKSKDENIKEVDELVKNYLLAYFTVDKNDYEFYDLACGDKKTDDQQKLQKEMFKNADKFKAYFTEKSYRQFILNRVQTDRIEAAYKGKYYAQVKSISLKKPEIYENPERMVYECSINVMRTSLTGEGDKFVTINQQVSVYKEQEGWRAMPFRPSNTQ